MPDTPPLLTAEDVAAQLGLAPKTVKRLAVIGKLRSVRIGHRTVRFTQADVDQFIAERKTEAAS